MHYFPLWEKDVHDVMQARFKDLISIFSHYAKSGVSATAEDAVEMTMSEFKDLVKDTQMETKDLRFDVMCNMFIKANALNTNAVREQRMNERKSAESKQEGPSDKASKGAAKTGGGREKRAASKKDQEMDQELVLYEFCALLIRISFWRSNPYFGLHKLATKLVPFPDCLVALLDECVLPNAKRDDSLVFREKLQNDPKLLQALEQYDAKLKSGGMRRPSRPTSARASARSSSSSGRTSSRTATIRARTSSASGRSIRSRRSPATSAAALCTVARSRCLRRRWPS